jgi:hypothetical protein
MSAGLPLRGPGPPLGPLSLPSHLDRAVRLYRRRIGRCRTENQLNRIHIAIENYMTPAEVRHFGAALAGDAADTPSRRWIEGLAGALPVKTARPVEFERRAIVKGVSLYSAAVGSAAGKTLLIGFAGRFLRLMLPTAWVLDCLNPALYDVVVLRDFSRLSFALGIPGLGNDIFAVLSGLRGHVDPGAYRNAISLGTSGGGVPALMAAILLGLDRGISVGGQDMQRIAVKLAHCGLNGDAYAALLASRPNPFPELILAYGENCQTDAQAAFAQHQLMPSRLAKVRNCPKHGVLKWHLLRGTLPAFLAKVLGQSLENRNLGTMTL